MEGEQRDEQADALEKLARGEISEPEMPISSGSVNLGNQPVFDSTPAPPLPQAAVKKSVRPPAPGSAKPAVQPSAVPAPQVTASPPRFRPSAPVQPAAPRERPAAPPMREEAATPAPAPVQPSEHLELSSALANVVEDSDVVFAPAPDMSVLARAKPRAIARRTPYMRSMHFRQTIIPVLLVLGVSLPGLAIYWLMLNRDSLLRSAGIGLPIVLASVGLVMLGLAILNMLAVNHELTAAKQAALTEKSVTP